MSNLTFNTGDYVILHSEMPGHIASISYETNELLVDICECTRIQVPFSDVISVNDQTVIVS